LRNNDAKYILKCLSSIFSVEKDITKLIEINETKNITQKTSIKESEIWYTFYTHNVINISEDKRVHFLLEIDAPSHVISIYESVEDWLARLNLLQYTKNFIDRGYKTTERMKTITNEVLEKDFEINVLAHKLIIMDSISHMN